MAANESNTSDNVSNDAIRMQIARMYADFVAEVDPDGVIMDYLIQEEVLTFERRDKIVSKTTKQDRCRKMLDELFNSTNPKAFVVLREALMNDGMTWIVERIDEQVAKMVTASKDEDRPEAGSDSFLVQRLTETEETNKRLLGELKDSKAEIENLQKQLQESTAKEQQLQLELDHAKDEIKGLQKQLQLFRENPAAKSQVVKRKLVIVGSGATGKSCLLNVIRSGEFPKLYMPTVFESFVVRVEIDGRQVDVSLWDTAGQDEYDRLRAQSYTGTDVFLLCYNIGDRTTLEDVKKKWHPEVRKHSRNVPIVLVGNAVDLRNVESAKKDQLVSVEEGQRTADEIGAKAFVECSAKTTEGVREMYETALRLTLKSSNKRTRSVCKQQ